MPPQQPPRTYQAGSLNKQTLRSGRVTPLANPDLDGYPKSKHVSHACILLCKDQATPQQADNVMVLKHNAGSMSQKDCQGCDVNVRFHESRPEWG